MLNKSADHTFRPPVEFFWTGSPHFLCTAPAKLVSETDRIVLHSVQKPNLKPLMVCCASCQANPADYHQLHFMAFASAADVEITLVLCNYFEVVLYPRFLFTALGTTNQINIISVPKNQSKLLCSSDFLEFAAIK